jgi:hypothetical protein
MSPKPSLPGSGCQARDVPKALVNCCRSQALAGSPSALATRLHRRSPAETDMLEYFRVSPPSVHQMVLTLERAGFIRRQPRTPCSIELLVDPKELPMQDFIEDFRQTNGRMGT